MSPFHHSKRKNLMFKESLQTKNSETVGNGVKFDRIRRITGYLVGYLDRFNNAKRSEEHDRVCHTKKEN